MLIALVLLLKIAIIRDRLESFKLSIKQCRLGGCGLNSRKSLSVAQLSSALVGGINAVRSSEK